MATNLFKKAKALDPMPKAKTTAKKNAVTRELIGLEKLAIVNAAINLLEDIKRPMMANIKRQLRMNFISDRTNFTGIEGRAVASAECKRRGSGSPLNDAEQETLKVAGVSFDTITKRPRLFVINPEKATDQKFLARVSAVLKGIDGIDDFIMVQEAEEIAVVTDQTLDDVWSKGKAKDLIDMVSVLAVKVSLSEDVDPVQMMNEALPVVTTFWEEEAAAVTAHHQY